jgi:DNA-binding CsgD family transcriptional regulator
MFEKIDLPKSLNLRDSNRIPDVFITGQSITNTNNSTNMRRNSKSVLGVSNGTSIQSGRYFLALSSKTTFCCLDISHDTDDILIRRLHKTFSELRNKPAAEISAVSHQSFVNHQSRNLQHFYALSFLPFLGHKTAMGRKRYISSKEKAMIRAWLLENVKTSEIAAQLGRAERAIRKHVAVLKKFNADSAAAALEDQDWQKREGDCEDD